MDKKGLKRGVDRWVEDGGDNWRNMSEVEEGGGKVIEGR